MNEGNVLGSWDECMQSEECTYFLHLTLSFLISMKETIYDRPLNFGIPWNSSSLLSQGSFIPVKPPYTTFLRLVS